MRDSSKKVGVNSSDLCSPPAQEDKETSPVEVSEKTLGTGSARSGEVESVDLCSAGDGDKEVLHAEKLGEKESAHECSSDTEDTETLHVDVSNQISRNTAEKVGEEDVPDLHSSEKDDKEAVKVVSSEQILGTTSESVGERDDGTVATRNALSGCSLEKEFRSAKHLKVDKVKKWASIRPVLGAIENMMSFRVRKSKYMEDAAQWISRAEEPPPVEDTRPPTETLEGELEFDLVPRKKIRSSPEEKYFSKRVPTELLFPWKDELECLVQGGVPKDLRGEVGPS